MGMVDVFRVLCGLEGTGRVAVAVVEGTMERTGRAAMVVAAVLVGASMKVVIVALDSKEGSSNFLILNCFLLAWWFTFLLLFLESLVFFFLGVSAFTSGDMMGLLG